MLNTYLCPKLSFIDEIVDKILSKIFFTHFFKLENEFEMRQHEYSFALILKTM